MTGARQLAQTPFAQVPLDGIGALADLPRGEPLVERGQADHQFESFVLGIDWGGRLADGRGPYAPATEQHDPAAI